MSTLLLYASLLSPLCNTPLFLGKREGFTTIYICTWKSMCYNDIVLQDKETSHWRRIIMPLEKLIYKRKGRNQQKGYSFLIYIVLGNPCQCVTK
jgi:hypothetical protein